MFAIECADYKMICRGIYLLVCMFKIYLYERFDWINDVDRLSL